jgi:hypothetical protein
MKKIITFFIILNSSFSLHAQLTIDFTWCPVYDTSLQTCCIQFENLTVDSGGGTIGGYIWDFGDGDTSNHSDPIHCYPVTGSYTVYLTVFYNGNVLVPISHSLTITHLDTTSCNCDSLIGVKEIPFGNYSFSLAPNPFHNRTILKWSAIVNENTKLSYADFRIYNSLGALMRVEKVALRDQQEIIIERKSLPPGFYHFEISTKDSRQVAFGKFLIE